MLSISEGLGRGVETLSRQPCPVCLLSPQDAQHSRSGQPDQKRRSLSLAPDDDAWQVEWSHSGSRPDRGGSIRRANLPSRSVAAASPARPQVTPNADEAWLDTGHCKRARLAPACMVGVCIPPSYWHHHHRRRREYRNIGRKCGSSWAMSLSLVKCSRPALCPSPPFLLRTPCPATQQRRPSDKLPSAAADGHLCCTASVA